MPNIEHIDHPAAATCRAHIRELEKALNEYEQLRQSYDAECLRAQELEAQNADLRRARKVAEGVRDRCVAELEGQNADLAEQVDLLRREISQLTASCQTWRNLSDQAAVLLADLAAELGAERDAHVREMGPLPEAHMAEAAFGQLAPAADRRVPLYKEG